MIKYDIANEFSSLREFTVSLPETFNNIGSVMTDYRNVIKKITTPEGTFVVKDFKGMYFLNRVSYSLVTISKAERSYKNSARLNEKGIATPPHVAWLDCYTGGLLTRSFFISAYYPYETFRDILQRNMQNEPVKASLYRHLLKFIVKLHRLGIYHEDFSLANILISPNGDGFDFSLVDLNRVRFTEVNFRKGMQNFNKLDMPAEDLHMLIKEYAIEAGEAPEPSLTIFLADNKRAMLLRRSRKTLRRYTITPLEKLFKETIPNFLQR